MTKKTLRFYEEREGHAKALKLLSNCKNYGFRDENQMLIELLLAFGEQKEDLAEQIAKKVVEKLGEGLVYSPFPKETNDTFLKACAFMDEL